MFVNGSFTWFVTWWEYLPMLPGDQGEVVSANPDQIQQMLLEQAPDLKLCSQMT